MHNIKPKIYYGVIFLLPFILTACLFPEEFESDVEINRDGTFYFTYEGTLAFVPGVMEEYRRGKLSPKANEEMKGLEEELKKDGAFKKVEYVGHSRYEVRYEKTGSLDKPFYFLGNDMKLFSIIPKGDGVIEVKGVALGEKDISRLEALGLGIDGELTVETDGKVLEHNADSTPSLFGLVGGYEWEIESLEKPQPRILISIK